MAEALRAEYPESGEIFVVRMLQPGGSDARGPGGRVRAYLAAQGPR